MIVTTNTTTLTMIVMIIILKTIMTIIMITKQQLHWQWQLQMMKNDNYSNNLNKGILRII